MCAFQIGLYALGLHNSVTQNWLSRTYSSHVSWITGQAMEIGSMAILVLMDGWYDHLTPPEAASMADKASKSRDNGMVSENRDKISRFQILDSIQIAIFLKYLTIRILVLFRSCPYG